jgi:hypothetical protein
MTVKAAQARQIENLTVRPSAQRTVKARPVRMK